MEQSINEHLTNLEPTHAGCVVFIRNGEVMEYLMVTSTGPDKRWVIPKGHIEFGETTEIAAMRELKEETGLEGEIIRDLGLTRPIDTLKEKGIVVRFYLVKANDRNAGSIEGRSFAWLSYDEVKERLKDLPETREVFERVEC